jgi:hypothetical protein
MKTVYIPEGVKTIETLGFFEIPLLENVYSYKSETPVTDSHYVSDEALGKVYNSLPEGLEYIGSDAFSYNQALDYMYVPENVKYIGHHAFWATVYKEDRELKGVTYIDVAADEETFKNNVEEGVQWIPKFDNGLFPKDIEIRYNAERKAITN